ncbi:hypothetical protein ACFWUU_04280 [Kribbella sp. NPDC058693]|uniref:hypothetical protein n=1 Tax=Kribbella sp. NPDC058693 TaxID=3346602 RepID=UPI0036539745
MSEFGNGAPGTYKTIGVQIPNDLHSQASMIAKLDDISLRDACIRGLRIYVEQKQAEPDFKARVAKALEDIEREAAERRGAIESLFGSTTQAAGTTPARKTAAAKKAAPSPKPES